jgi:hypothetical protein
MMAMRLQADCRKPRGGRGRCPAWWASGLFGLLVVLLLAGGVPAVHAHQGPGLYDEECPLVWLALPRPGAAVTSVPTVGPPAGIPDPVAVFVVTGPAPASLASFDPRAPPLPTLSPILAH